MSDDVEAADTLRSKAFESGRYLVARQLAGMVVRTAGILAITRLIGPTEYGLFAGSVGLMAVLSTLAIFGIDVHLVRSGRDSPAAEHTAFTLLLGSSIILAVLAFVAAPGFGALLDDDDAVAPFRVLALLLPLVVLWVPARARLERALAFRTVAAIELASDLIVYVVAVPAALAGAGVWAPVAGFAARHAWLFGATVVAAGFRPRLRVDRDEAVAAFRFGSGYSAASWVTVAADLVNPLVIGGLLGPTAIGHVALASRLVEQLSAVKHATLRLATVALAKLADQPDRLRRAHAEGMRIQVLGTAVPLAGAAFLGPWLIPLVFGDEWEPVPELVSLLAVASVIGALFNLHSTTLQVLGRNAPVVRLRAVQLVLLIGGAWTLAGPLGVVAYGWARVGRSLGFVLIDRDVRSVFAPRYLPALRWLVVLVPAMASPWLPPELRPVLLVPAVAVLLSRSRRSELLVLVDQVRGRARA
ncbi:MAG: oligosaccharide flippase family protein [Actinomycetota bacterium]